MLFRVFVVLMIPPEPLEEVFDLLGGGSGGAAAAVFEGL